MSYGVTRIPDRHDPRVVAANERVRAVRAANGVDVGAGRFVSAGALELAPRILVDMYYPPSPVRHRSSL